MVAWDFGNKEKQMMKKNKHGGFSLLELLIVVAIILIIASIAIPNLLRSRMSANEAAAVAVIRNVHNAQAVYIVQYTNSVGYASTLLALGPGTPCSKAAACLTDQLVGCAAEPCLKSGYMFYMNSTSSGEPYGDYTASATPITWSRSGNNNFCSTEDGVIRKQKNAAASLSAGTIHSDCMDSGQFNPLGG
jgi:prepilin-type N-terminal cleavage/methylation domain-containing protein